MLRAGNGEDFKVSKALLVTQALIYNMSVLFSFSASQTL